MSIYKYLCVLSICLITSFSLKAQTEELPSADSSVVVQKPKKIKAPKKERDYSKLNPTKATIFSTLIPGLGQAYNYRYWKIPIIYGLGIWTISTALESHDEYSVARNNINFIQENDDVEYVDNLTESQWRDIKDDAKRLRDLNIIYAVAIYGLQIMDAAVDAHLLRFHDSDKFLAEIEPTFIRHRSHNVAALSLNFRLK